MNPDLVATVHSALPGIRVVNPADATLLGSPIGDIGSITVAIDAKTAMLKCLHERLHYLTSHDAYLLLRHSLAIPKLLYLLRTSPCFLSSSLKIYDDEIRAKGSFPCSILKSAGRHHRHSAVNDIIYRALVAAHVPSRLEPSGLFRSDGKRPDGVSIVPWKCGQLMVWDATCPDTLAPSYSTIAAHQVGAVAQQAENRKTQKYKHLESCYFFTPVAIETSGVIGPKTLEFLKELGHQLRQVSREAYSFAYLTQRLSVAVQRGNAASVLGTMKMGSQEEEFFSINMYIV
eukprot:Em0010g28a